MKCAAPGCFGFSLKDRLRNGGGEGVTAEPRLAGTNGAEQQQRVEDRDFVIVRPLSMHLGHRLRVRHVAIPFFAWCVEKIVDRSDVGRFFRVSSLGETPLPGRRQPLECRPTRLDVDLGPERVVATHRLAPVGEREVGIDRLGLPKRLHRFIELKAVELLDPLDEGRPSAGCGRGLETNRLELLRTHGAEPCDTKNGGDRDTDTTASHRYSPSIAWIANRPCARRPCLEICTAFTRRYAGGASGEMERETGFEPATSTLARSHSTTELFPLARKA